MRRLSHFALCLPPVLPAQLVVFVSRPGLFVYILGFEHAPTFKVILRLVSPAWVRPSPVVLSVLVADATIADVWWLGAVVDEEIKGRLHSHLVRNGGRFIMPAPSLLIFRYLLSQHWSHHKTLPTLSYIDFAHPDDRNKVVAGRPERTSE